MALPNIKKIVQYYFWDKCTIVNLVKIDWIAQKQSELSALMIYSRKLYLNVYETK